MKNKALVLQYCNRFSLLLHFLASFVGYLIIEAISRHSLWQAFGFMTGRPWVFLYNTLLIFTTTTIVYLFKRRVFARALVALFWLVLGCINGGLLAVRVTPFTGPDLKLVGDAFAIMNKYLSVPLMILAVIGILLLIAGMVWLFLHSPKYQGKINYPVSILMVAAASLTLAAATNLAQQKGCFPIILEILPLPIRITDIRTVLQRRFSTPESTARTGIPRNWWKKS